MSFQPDNFANAPRVLPIPGHPSYFASSDGRIYSKLSGRHMRELVPDRSPATGPYLRLKLGAGRHYRVHRLVASAFLPVPAHLQGRKIVCRHLDDNPHNNRVENLAWGTQSDNMLDRRGKPTDQAGEGNPAAKLTAADVAAIRHRRARGETLKVIAADFDISPSHVSNIALGHNWNLGVAS